MLAVIQISKGARRICFGLIIQAVAAISVRITEER